MSLPWFRVDVGIGSHDKTLRLLSDPSTKRWQAFVSYLCAIGWSVEQETDGRIPTNALPFVHGTNMTARLLVAHRFWEPTLDGWQVHNYDLRQPLAATIEATRNERKLAAARAACVRWHGPNCWGPKGCTHGE